MKTLLLVGNSEPQICQRGAIWGLLGALCLGSVFACGQAATSEPDPTPTTQANSQPMSQPLAETKPVVDKKASCTAAPKQASMFLVQDKAGLTNGAMIPSGAKTIVADKPAGPGTRKLVFNNGGKDYALRYSFPDGAQLPAEVGVKIDIGRTRSSCTIGMTDGWRVSDAKGVLALVDAGGCAPAWPEEVIPGLKITAEDVGCEAKGEEAIERACAVKVITKEGEEVLAPGESRTIELEKGKFSVSAGLCALALRDIKKTNGRRSLGEFRISYAVRRVE
jgi:hypothetical protein